MGTLPGMSCIARIKEKNEKMKKKRKKKGKKAHGCINKPWALVKWEVGPLL